MMLAKHSISTYCIGAFIALTANLASALDTDILSLLKQSDTARGGSLPGIEWQVQVSNSNNKQNADQLLRIRAYDVSSLAEVLEPKSAAGSKMLQVDRKMWLSKPGLSKPAPISPRLRLTGQAAIGDIAATNYAKDYNPALLRHETINNEDCIVLSLKGKTKNVTYDQITYWIATKRGVAVKAQFLSLSGKPIKSAEFEYNNVISYQGAKIPFMSKMTIVDATSNESSTLQYSQIQVKKIPAGLFNADNL